MSTRLAVFVWHPTPEAFAEIDKTPIKHLVVSAISFLDPELIEGEGYEFSVLMTPSSDADDVRVACERLNTKRVVVDLTQRMGVIDSTAELLRGLPENEYELSIVMSPTQYEAYKELLLDTPCNIVFPYNDNLKKSIKSHKKLDVAKSTMALTRIDIADKENFYSWLGELSEVGTCYFWSYTVLARANFIVPSAPVVEEVAPSEPRRIKCLVPVAYRVSPSMSARVDIDIEKLQVGDELDVVEIIPQSFIEYAKVNTMNGARYVATKQGNMLYFDFIN